jgi:hypothetical protein
MYCTVMVLYSPGEVIARGEYWLNTRGGLTIYLLCYTIKVTLPHSYCFSQILTWFGMFWLKGILVSWYGWFDCYDWYYCWYD